MEEPTRKDNVLDLILTNRPNKVLRVDVLPGVSDHDIVFTELAMRPVKQKKKPRQIPIYRKAEWEPRKEDMKSLHKYMEAMYNSKTTGVNEMWEKFRDTLQHSINCHIPHRQSRSKDGYPWIGPELKKMMKRQHRYYKIKKKTGDPQHVKCYLDLKHQVQKRHLPGRVAQSVTCLATDACLTAIPGVANSIPARSHTFMEIDHEIISTVILLPSADLFKKGCYQLRVKVCARITG